jgi:predicted flap endonuclease-1-like 5' DNA nuclease
MQDMDNEFAQRNVRFFRMLAIVAGAGVAAALILGLGGITGPGLFQIGPAVTSSLLMGIVILVVLILFLLRIGVIFDVEKQVKSLFNSEAERLAAARKAEEDAQREFRDSLRRDLADLKESMRREFNERDGKFDNAILAANKAMKMAQDALARAEALSKEPAYRTTIEQLVKDVADMKKDLTALRTADKVNSPLLAELKERVTALEGAQKKTNVRIDETLEGMERRDMEQAALRQTLDNELGNFRKREALLLVKQRELEDNNTHLAQAAKPKAVKIAPGEEKHHVIEIEGIGPAFATRLNANGVITIPQLLAANPEQIGPAIDAMPDLVREWQSMATLMRLKGVGPQSAEVLVRAGIRNIPQLAAEDAEALSAKVKDAERGRKVRIQGLDVTPGVAKRWIDAARKGEFDAH